MQRSLIRDGLPVRLRDAVYFVWPPSSSDLTISDWQNRETLT